MPNVSQSDNGRIFFEHQVHELTKDLKGKELDYNKWLYLNVLLARTIGFRSLITSAKTLEITPDRQWFNVTIPPQRIESDPTIGENSVLTVYPIVKTISNKHKIYIGEVEETYLDFVITPENYDSFENGSINPRNFSVERGGIEIEKPPSLDLNLIIRTTVYWLPMGDETIESVISESTVGTSLYLRPSHNRNEEPSDEFFKVEDFKVHF